MGRCTLVLIVAALLLAGCARTPAHGPDEAPPWLASDVLGAVEWAGQARGPLGVLGPRASLHVFTRADGALRAEIRYTPEGGPPVHEVLIWTSETALLFDRRTGRFSDLGARPGRVDALEASFAVFDAIWLLTGHQVSGGPDTWQRRDDVWRGRAPERGWSRPAARPVPSTRLVWRDGASVRTLRARVEAHDDGTGLPRTLRIEGDGLEGPIILEWSRVRPVAALGDSILDPLWEPAAAPSAPSREP